MWKSIGTKNTYLSQPCERCGSKRRISATWTEETSILTGTEKVEVSQIICTNVTCQNAFEERLTKERTKREELKRKKDEDTTLRKLKIQQARKIRQIPIS